MDDILKLANEIAEKAHAGQYDKAGKPYIEHPRFVANCVIGNKEKVLALLHDVIEDSEVTLVDLKNIGIPEEIVNAVDVLTRKSGEEYKHYIVRIKDNELAKTVKLADLRHNSDISRISNPTKEDKERVDKYNLAIEFLER